MFPVLSSVGSQIAELRRGLVAACEALLHFFGLFIAVQLHRLPSSFGELLLRSGTVPAVIFPPRGGGCLLPKRRPDPVDEVNPGGESLPLSQRLFSGHLPWVSAPECVESGRAVRRVQWV